MNISDLNGEAYRLQEIHAESGLDYKMPDFSGEKACRFPIRRAVTDNGELLAAALVKVGAEVYLFVDHASGTPQTRWDAVRAINADIVDKAKEIGFDQLHCCIPPELQESFGPRIEALGWQKARDWQVYTLEVQP